MRSAPDPRDGGGRVHRRRPRRRVAGDAAARAGARRRCGPRLTPGPGSRAGGRNPMRSGAGRVLLLLLSALAALAGCNRSPASRTAASPPEEPSPRFRTVETPTAYGGDSAGSTCHAREAAAYRQHPMAQSFHRWTPATRLETPLEVPLHHATTGFSYSVVDSGGRLYQGES